ncbi:MAG: (Fe-S)-binding protein [Candidatus Helarchaeota archaeon]
MSLSQKILYYVGCTTCHLYPETGKAMKKILDTIGIDVEIRDDEPCCGGALFIMGHIGEGIKKVKENIEYFKIHKIGKIIVNCPECYKTLKYDYPKVEKEFNIQVQHSTEIIAQAIKEGKLSLSKEVPLKITYHDSCHLGRYGGLYDEPRFIIKSIPGIKYKEMEFYKEHAVCCGGPIREPYIELRNQMSLTNLDLAKRIKHLVTACPTCYYNLDGVAQLFEHKVKVIELINLVAYSAGLISEIPGVELGG